MQKIKLLKMIFENFKGYKLKEVEFGNITSLSGENESGKTTIADGYNWLFFDKSYKLKSNPTVRPEKDGVSLDDVFISIEATCELNGKEVTFKKIQKQVKNEDGVVCGTMNSCLINSVEKNKGNFEDYIKDELGINMNEFLACTNPNQFMRQNQKDMRPILFKMAKNYKDIDIARSVPELKILEELLEKYTLEEIISMNNASVSKLEKDIKSIPVRIDEVTKTIVDIDVAERELQRNDLKRQISEKDILLSDNEKIFDEFKKFSDGILELNFQINSIVQESDYKLTMERRNLQKKVDEASQHFSEIEGKHKLITLDIERLNAAIEKNNSERKALGDEYNAIVSSEFDDSKWIFDKESTVCPNCGQEYPEDRIDQIRAEFSSKKENAILEFEKNKELQKKNKISSGNELKAKAERDRIEISELEKDIEQCKINKISFNKEKTEAMVALAKSPNFPDLSENQEYERLCLERDAKKKAMESMNSGADYRSSIKTEIENLKEELLEVEKIISSADNSKSEQRIEDLNNENKELIQERANCRRILDGCDTLSKTKNELLVEEINKHFSIVKWQLFDYQLNGKYKEICVPTIDGYRFDESTNEGREIIAKLDICNSLQKFFGINVPVFLDGAESINDKNIPVMDCQLVLLKVTDDTKLKVEVVR